MWFTRKSKAKVVDSSLDVTNQTNIDQQQHNNSLPNATLETVDGQLQRQNNQNSNSNEAEPKQATVVDVVGGEAEKNDEDKAMARHQRQLAKCNKSWNRRLKLMTCCFGYSRNKDTINEIAGLLAEFFADVDVSVPQTTAAFVLLCEQQDAQRRWMAEHRWNGISAFLSNEPITPQTKYLDITNAADAHLLSELMYYLNYALAIFGWPMSMIDDPCFFCCICPYLRWPSLCRNKRQQQKLAKNYTLETGENVEEADSDADEEHGHDNHLAGHSVGDRQSSSEQLTAGQSSDAINTHTEPTDYNSIRHKKTATQAQSEETSKRDGKNKNKMNKKKKKRRKRDAPAVKPIVLDDNCCSCNLASFNRRLRVHNYEVIYVSYRGDVNVVPFIVAADHSKRAIVVSIRGSMSMYDAVTDFNGKADKFPMEGCPSNWYCHKGMARAALNVKATLETDRVLERAFNSRPDLATSEYSLVFCGHSLGAGVATILGIFFRKQYPNLKAYLYGPPGGTLSLSMLDYTKQFATAVIFGNDVVSRMGIAQFERLRYCALHCLQESQKTSSKIITKSLFTSSCCRKSRAEFEPETSLDTLFCQNQEPFVFGKSKVLFESDQTVLYAPGRIMHIVRNDQFVSSTKSKLAACCPKSNRVLYQAVWIENKNLDRIIIANNMLRDHLPNYIMYGLKMLFCKTLAPSNQQCDDEPNESPNSNNMCDITITRNKFEQLTMKLSPDKQTQATNNTETKNSTKNNNTSASSSSSSGSGGNNDDIVVRIQP